MIPIDGQCRIYADGALAIARQCIVAVGRSADIEKAYRAEKTIDAHGGAVLPDRMGFGATIRWPVVS